MAQIIGETYEIIEKIGSGGGGIVYLANHLRLRTKVVLKADKRKTTTRTTLLRREVDVLKELRHPNIPRVLDYLIEDGTVYTAMEYIEGESLDRPLKRGETFPQREVIRWTAQLLDALAYLHSPIHGEPPRGYVHSDIKPANLMRRPDGSICLIDFNIALAMGEENVVGKSPGYSSPEIYGSGSSPFDRSDTSAERGDSAGTAVEGMSSESGHSRDLRTAYDTGAPLSSTAGPVIAGQTAYDTGAPLSSTAGPVIAGQTEYDTGAPRPQAAYTITGQTEYDTGAPPRTPVGPAIAGQTEYDGSGNPAEDLMDTVSGDITSGDTAPGMTESSAVDGHTGSTGGDLSAVTDHSASGSSSTPVRKVMPDARSDIYSVGATMYHLLSGTRPDADAAKVVPLRESSATRPVIEMVTKAMSPDPDQRYQSAEEMLSALGTLRDRDPDTSRLRRTRRILTAVSACLFLTGAAVTAVGWNRVRTLNIWRQKAQEARTELTRGDREKAVSLVKDTVPEKQKFYLPDTPAECVSALSDSLGVYNLIDGYRAERTVTLPSKPVRVAIAPDGSSAACICEWELKVIDPDTGEIRTSLPAMDSSRSGLTYIGNDVILYAGKDGITAWNTKQEKTVWTGEKVTSLSVSGDGKTVAALFRDETFAALYNTEDGQILGRVDFGGRQQDLPYNDRLFDPGDNLFLLNEDGSSLTVSFSDGSVVRFDMGPDGQTERELSYEETEAIYESMEGAVSTGDAGETDAAAADGSAGDTGGSRSAAFYKEVKENYPEMTLLAAGDTHAVAGSVNSPVLVLYEFADRSDAEAFRYDAEIPHTEARVSPDGMNLTVFSYSAFYVYDKNGKKTAEKFIPDAELVYDIQYRSDENAALSAGAYLEVTWYDGRVVLYDAVSGDEIGSDMTEPPDVSLYEELETESFRIVSELHMDPVVYEKPSGKVVQTVREDGFLTYVTECGSVIAAQYLTADGNRYGVLYNRDFEEIGRVPGLCDVDAARNILYADDGNGSIRETRIRMPAELRAEGEETS